jgi:putative DNA primase/helicase
MPDGGHICNQCGGGDGFGLIQKVTGLSFPETIKKVSEIIGFVEMDNVKEKPKTDPKEALNKVWNASTKLTGSDPVSKYLHSRKLVLTPDNVRYCPKCWESDTKKELPAMVARVQNKEGKPISLHRTYLNGTGKADIPSPKKTMTPTEPLPGAAVRLFMPGGLFDAETLGVAEGIETAIAAAQLYSIATWSVLSTAIMEKFDPPAEFNKIMIFADNDYNFSGAVAAYNLAKRLYLSGLLVEVIMPPPGDMNDALLKEVTP